MGVNPVSPLQVALSGLRVAQAQIGVASNNIANASTDGYTKKSIAQYTIVIGGQAAGVDVGNIKRHINDILLKDFRRQTSVTSNLTTTRGYLDQVQRLHGTPESESSITFQIGRLKTALSQLANQPESQFLLTGAFDAAKNTVEQFSDYATSLTQMRNATQNDMTQAVNSINELTRQIADLNVSIKFASSQGRSVADLQDQRDLAIRNLSEQMNISYYENPDNTTTVMTYDGQLLADVQAIPLYFNPQQLGAQSYYPATAKPLMLGDATTGTDLTTEPNLGGKLGALVKLRDTTLPTYQAQMDELAYQMASRFHSEGLDLFTMPDGSIPLNDPAAYAGFSQDMVVNPAISLDKSLIRKGTSPLSTVQDGSNEVLRKIVEFTFGDVAYQEGVAATTISTGPGTLFTELGLTGQARIIGTQNIQSAAALDDSAFINPGVNDTFTLQVGAGLPQTITITAGMNASALVSAINTAIPGTAALSSGGQLILTANADLTIAAGGPTGIGTAGLAELGLTPGVTAAQSPSFSVSVGNNEPTVITIAPTDTGTQLLSKLNAVPGLTATLVAGKLHIRPTEGGDLTVIDGLKTPLAALGLTMDDVLHAPFNINNLGPGANLNGNITGAPNLTEYATQVIGAQSQDAGNTITQLTIESSYRSTLESELTNDSGVNIDEEMAHLIAVQTAYNASARAISVVQQMMDELLNAVR